MKSMQFLHKYRQKPIGGLFQWLYWNFFFVFFPLLLIVAILSLFGVVPFTLNDVEYTGILGFIYTLVIIPLIPLPIAVLFWLYLSVGNYFLRLFTKYM